MLTTACMPATVAGFQYKSGGRADMARACIFMQLCSAMRPSADLAEARQALAARDFVPEIRRIRGVSRFATPSVWDVETDRGDTSLVLRGEEHIRRLGASGLMVADQHLHRHAAGGGTEFLDRLADTGDRGGAGAAAVGA